MSMASPLRVVFSCVALAASLAAQTTPTFTVRAQLPDSTVDLVDAATLTMTAGGLGQTVSANLTFTNISSSTPTINFFQVSGSSDFTFTGPATVPFSTSPNGTFTAQMTYKATSSVRATSRVIVNFNVGTSARTLTLNFAGIAPEFVYSYIPQGGNQTVIADGGTIRFPDTPTETTSATTIVLTNRGTAPGTFNAAAVTGADFVSVGVPVAGTAVESTREIRFTVNYSPKLLGQGRGALVVETADRRVSFNLEAMAAGPRYTYEYQGANGPQQLQLGQVITLPDARVGDKTSVVLRVRNTGNAEGKILAISVAGTGYTLTEVPLLPLTVKIGEGFSFTINFQHTAPGRALGRLRVGIDDFDLSTNALGSTLTYSYTANNTVTAVLANGSVNFTPVAVGGTSRARFVITNEGTAAATVSSIGLAAPSTVFILENVPGLPVNLEPGASVGLDMKFLPVALGISTATLRIDNQTFTLSGAGNAPPPLPTIRFDGASGNQDPLAQPAVGLAIERAYPLTLTGTLTLAFNSDVFSNDPAVQFATGGRTVTFTIPADTTRAIFPNNQNQIRVQTGSVAGTITLIPAISTQDGGIVLTPATPPTANMMVQPGAPRILSVAVGQKTANAITLLVSGYVTSRSVTQIDLNFTPVAGENVATSRLTIPAEGAFVGWYTNQQSGAFGSLFTAAIPLTLAGDIKNVTGPADTLQSVSVTLANRQGTSPAVSLNLR